MTDFTITFTVPNGNATDVLNTLSSHRGYTGFDPGGVAETRANFLRRIYIDDAKRDYRNAKAKAAADSAAATALSDADAVPFT